MQKFNILLLATALFLCSCGSDSLTSESIVGTWTLQSTQFTECDDSAENFVRTERDADGCAPVGDESLICNTSLAVASGGTATISFVDEDGDQQEVDFTYTVNEDTEIAMFDDGDDIATVTFQDGDLIWIQDVDDGCVITIEFSM